MQTLYEITDDIQDVLDMLDDPDIPDEAIHNTLEGLEHSLGDKLDAIAALVEKWKSQAERVDKEAQRLVARKRVLNNRAQRLKGYALFHLTKLNKSTLETDLHNFTVRKGAERVVVDDVDGLPDMLVRVERTPLKGEIRDALRQGADLPAHLERGKPSLIIK